MSPVALLLAVANTVAVTLPPELAAPACIACQADAQQVRSAYSEAQWAALTRGEIVTANSQVLGPDDAVRSSVECVAIITHPPPEVWAVVTDFESRPRYIPDAKEIRVVRVDGNRLWTFEHLRILLFNIRFQVVNTLDPERGVVTWTLDKSVDHDIADTTGSWQLVPLVDGQQTLARYRAFIDSGQPVPGVVEKWLTARSLPRMVGGVRDEVQRRFPSLHQ